MTSKRKVLVLFMLCLLWFTIVTSLIMAAKRAPPYANAKVSEFEYPDPPWFASADAKAEALPGYGYAYVYAYVYTSPAATSSTASAGVEFNANPVPGNSPVLGWVPSITGSATIYVKGNIGSQGALSAKLYIGFDIYSYQQGKWVHDPYKSKYVTLGEGVHNKTYKIEKTSDYSEDAGIVEKYTITSYTRATAQRLEGAECEAVVDFYTGKYPERVVFVSSLGLTWPGE